MSAFRAYLEAETVDFAADGASYWIEPLSLTVDELLQLKESIQESLRAPVSETPARDAPRQLLAVAVIPSPNRREGAPSAREARDPG
jgi:hypothetical protein